MARRRSSTARTTRGKSESERRVELITWALLVLVFAVMQIVPEGSLPNYFVPLSGAIILLGSGLYQYAQRWRVSPVTWIGGVIMALLAYYGTQVNATRDFIGESLLIFFAVIAFGILTGET
jgi:carbon starvation protein CstA